MITNTTGINDLSEEYESIASNTTKTERNRHERIRWTSHSSQTSWIFAQEISPEDQNRKQPVRIHASGPDSPILRLRLTLGACGRGRIEHLQNPNASNAKKWKIWSVISSALDYPSLLINIYTILAHFNVVFLLSPFSISRWNSSNRIYSCLTKFWANSNWR